MTHRLPNKTGMVCSLPIPAELTYKPMALYSLFMKRDNRWIRISDNAYSEALAYRVFTARLASAPLTYQIKPIKIESDKVQGISHFGGKVLV